MRQASRPRRRGRATSTPRLEASSSSVVSRHGVHLSWARSFLFKPFMVDNWVSGKRLQEISGKPGEAGKRLRVINAGAGRVVSSNRKAAPCGAASPECNQLFHVGIMLHAVVGGRAHLRDRFLIAVM